MGAGAKHSPGQHTFEHGLLADAKQPGYYSPDIFAKYKQSGSNSADFDPKHNRPGHQSTGTNHAQHKRSGNNRSNRDGSVDLSEFEWCAIRNLEPGHRRSRSNWNWGWEHLAEQHTS